jgi:hypothetical protein
VFGWLKKKPKPDQPDARNARFVYHFENAVGSQVQRGCIAAGMVAIEAESVQKKRKKLTVEDQIIFMMTYECFVLRAIKRGLEAVLKPAEVEPIVVSVYHHFAKNGFYRPDVFEKIWDKMQIVMPIAIKPTPEGVIYPAADMITAPSLAGYPLRNYPETALAL